MGADGSVVRNGQIILDTRAVTGEVGPRHVTATVQLSGNDVLEVRLLGRKGSVLQIAIRPAGVHMTLTDRKCGLTYTSNKADVPQVIIQ